MAADQLFTIIGIALLWALIIGAATFMLLKALRRFSLVLQFCVVLLGTVAVMVAGMISAVNAMVVTARDLEIMWYIVGVASLVAVGLSILLGTRVARNATALTTAARTIGGGGTVQLMSGPMSSELASLAGELERTSERLERSRRREAAIEASRRELVTWISHDLRTPLASMRAMAEALEDGVATDVSGYHSQIVAQTDQMAAMVNDLLELSKIQEGSLHLSAESLHLYDLVSDAIADLLPLADRRGVTIDGSGVVALMAVGDGPSLARVVRNLILNAVLYTRDGTSVAITLTEENGMAVLAVRDQCGGLAEEDLQHVFTTGWQKTPGRSKDGMSGAGVGLGMASGIIKAHRGTLTVGNVADGCCFTAAIPQGEPADAAPTGTGVSS